MGKRLSQEEHEARALLSLSRRAEVTSQDCLALGRKVEGTAWLAVSESLAYWAHTVLAHGGLPVQRPLL